MRTLERLFGLSERRTTVGTELMGGLTTFMVMAYIIFVNPAILSFSGVKALEGQGPPFAPTLAFLVYFALPWLRPLFAV